MSYEFRGGNSVIYDRLDSFSSRSKIQLNDSLQSGMYLLLRGRFHENAL